MGEALLSLRAGYTLASIRAGRRCVKEGFELQSGGKRSGNGGERMSRVWSPQTGVRKGQCCLLPPGRGGGFSVVEVEKREALVVSSSLPSHLTSEKIHKLENLQRLPTLNPVVFFLCSTFKSKIFVLFPPVSFTQRL